MNTPLVAIEIFLVIFVFAFELDLAVDRILAVRLRHDDAQRKRSVLDGRREVGLVSGDHTFLKEKSVRERSHTAEHSFEHPPFDRDAV